MAFRIASPRPWGRVLTATAAAAGLLAAAALAAPPALAQNHKPAKTEKKKTPAKPAAPKQGAEANQPQFMYSPWIKICGKGKDTNNRKVCVVTKDGRLVENGVPVAIVQLFMPEGLPKILRVTVPLGMQLRYGTRVIIDNGTPVNEPYKICFRIGCMSDFPVTDEMIAQMKKGHTLNVQAVNAQGKGINLPLPLNDFAKAYDGPATDPKVFEAQQHKLQQELQKKAEEAREKLQEQQSGSKKK